MRKWLVGLLAAGLCAASAWATTDVLTAGDFEATSSTYKDFSGVTKDSGAVYAGNSGKSSDGAIQLRSNNSNSGIVSTESGGTATKVTLAWNAATVDDREVSVYGSTDAYTAATDLYAAASQGTLLGSLKKGDGATELEIEGEYAYIGLRSKSGALYLDSVEIEWAGASGPSVSLSASATEVEVGGELTVTATAKNFSADVEWVWEGNDGGSADGAVYTVHTAVAGEFTVKATATAGDEIAQKEITVTVTPALVPHAITVTTDGNGTAEADVAEAKAGEPVNLTVVPNDGYKLDSITVNGEAITGTSFEMPDADVTVAVTFKEITGEVYKRVESADDFEEGAEYLVVAVHAKGNFTSALKNETNGTRIGVEEVVVNEDNTVVTDDDSIVWTIQAGAEEGQYVLYNAAKGVYAAATKDDNVAQLLEDDTAALAQWTLKFDDAPAVGIWSVSYPERWLSRNSTAASAYFATYKGTQTAPFLFKKAGPSAPSVSLSASATEVEVGGELTITATAKNFSAEPEWSWTGNGTADGATFAVDTSVAGVYEVTATATAGEETASKSVTITVSEPAVKYAVNVAIGIQNGTVTTDVSEAAEGDPVTVTATPADGYRLVEIIVNNGEVAVTGNTFVMPAQDVLVTATFEEKPPVTGDVLTNDDVGTQSGSYVEWTATKESGAVYAGQSAGGSATNPCIQLRSNNSNSGIVMTKGSGKNVSSVTIEWNAQSAAERVVQVYGSTTPYSSPADLYGDAKGTLLGELTNGSGEVTVDVAAVGEFPYIGIRSKSSALYLTSVAIGFGGAAGPSVSLSASATEVAVGEPVTITATANNFSAEPEWSWTGNGTADGATFAVDTTVAGTYEVTATATAGEETASKSVTIKVVAKYAVNVALGIQHGTVTTDVSEAAEGDPVTVTATPADGYRLVEIIVNNGEVAVTGNTFVMPAQDVLVTATFEEFEVPPYYFQFETGKPAANSYKDTDADVVNTGSTSDTVPTVNFTLQRAGRGGDEKDKFVGTYALRMGPTNEVPAFFYNTEAFSEDITAISFQYGIYGTDKCESFTVSTSADGADWTQLADLTADASADGLKTYTNDELPAGVRFIRFDATSTQKSNIRRINIDEIQLWTGAPSPKIVYSGETTIALGGTFEIIFGLLNYDGDFEWVLDSREGGTIVPDGRDGLYTWTPTEATDGVTIKVVARSGELDIASKEVTLTVTEPGPQPGEPAIVFGGDDSGVVGQPVNFTVTAVNISDPTLYLDGFEFPADSSLTEADLTEDYPNVSFTPDAAGDYVFSYSAGEGDEYVASTLTITVTDEPGPQPTEPGITKMTIASGKMTIEFIGEGAQVLLSDDMEIWAPVDGAISPFSFDMKEAGKKYIGVR